MINKFVKYIFFVGFILLNTLGLAQEKMLDGMIVVDFRNDYPEGVVITNQNTKVYSMSDIAGTFRLKASVGDTLLFQGSFLVDRKFVVRKSSFDLKPLVIHMNYEIITLKDVIARAPLTGDLRKDIKSVKVRDDIEKLYANLGIDIRTLDMKPQEKKQDVIPKLGPIPIPTSLNVEALYKSLTGYYRKMENLNQFERLEQRLNDVREYLGVDFFEETLGIPESDIRGFLLYTYDHSNGEYESYYLQQDYLSLGKLFRDKAPIFKKRLDVRDRDKNETTY